MELDQAALHHAVCQKRNVGAVQIIHNRQVRTSLFQVALCPSRGRAYQPEKPRLRAWVKHINCLSGRFRHRDISRSVKGAHAQSQTQRSGSAFNLSEPRLKRHVQQLAGFQLQPGCGSHQLQRAPSGFEPRRVLG